MARRSSQQSVSLFPFLAVLVCTMGALILLLLVTTRRIRQEQARYTAAVEVLDDLESGSLPQDADLTANDFVVSPTAPANTPSTAANTTPASNTTATDTATGTAATDGPVFRKDWLPQTDHSQQEHEKLQAKIDSAAKRNAELQKESERLSEGLLEQQEQLAEVKLQIQETEMEMLTVGSEVRKLQQVQEELQELQIEKADLELQIDQQKQLLAGVQAELEEKSAFTEEAEALLTKRESALVSLRRIVAQSSEHLGAGSTTTRLEFTNTDGTSQVPIVINIDEKGFTFLPSGITVTRNDLKGFPANDNPLLAGIQATASHRSQGSAANDPYVLMLVRPSGSLDFYQAQKTMTNANIHFGYELLEADRTVSQGQPDAEEVSVVRQSVLAALNRRSNLYGALAAANQRFRPGSGALSGQPDDRLGPNGQTLQEQMNLGRFYAGGEPKPEPQHGGFSGADVRNRQWPAATTEQPEPAQQSVAANPPPTEMPPENARPSNGIALAEPYGWSQSAGPQAAGRQSVEEHRQTEPAVAAEAEGLPELEFRGQRSQQLSRNLGLNSQLASGEQPKASAVETLFDGHVSGRHVADGRFADGQQAARNSNSTPGSSDVDWPSIEAAPQSEGTRPVAPNLLSGFLGIAPPASNRETAVALLDIRPEAQATQQSPSDAPNERSSQSAPSPWDALAGQSTPTPQSAHAPQSTLAPQSAPAPSSGRFQWSDGGGPPSTMVQASPESAQPGAFSDVPSPQAAFPNPPASSAQAIPLLAPSHAANGSGQPSGNSGQQGTPSHVDPRLSYLQQFLDGVEQQRSQNTPNPVLLRMLRRVQANQDGPLSENLVTSQQQPPPASEGLRAPGISASRIQPPEATQPEATQPARSSLPAAVARAPQAAERRPQPAQQLQVQTQPTTQPRTTQQQQQPAQPTPQQPPQAKSQPQQPQSVYYVVRIYVSDDELIVGPFEAIDVKGWTNQQVAEAAYMGVSETMKEVWSDVRKDALPAVRFLTAPGSEGRSRATSQRLQSMKIPTRALQIEGVDFTQDQFFSDDLPPTTQSRSPSPSQQPRQHQAQPSNNGRVSI